MTRRLKEQKEAAKEQRELAILSDLRHPVLTYLLIAVRHGVGLNTICNIAKKHGLQRPRGPKPKNPSDNPSGRSMDAVRGVDVRQ
jgi:hypothetical protein